MNWPLPRLKPLGYLIFLVVGLALIALTAWLGGNDHDTYGWRLGYGFAQTGATIALGVFGASV